MSRLLRAWIPGGTYHITARGNRKEALFKEEEDFHRYLETLQSVKRKHPFVLHAYCLMPNHIHLLVEVTDQPPSTFMKILHMKYAIYFNKKYDLVGHVFQGRFHAHYITSIQYFLHVSRYIHLNPCAAKICAIPEEYRWSSYHEYMFPEMHKRIIEPNKLLSYFFEPRRFHYHEYVNDRKTDVTALAPVLPGPIPEDE
ncbi:transposase [Sediminibacillus dalangtanensis]|uniref:Transposase n=1 Tax=Sediminibacillus dalangtanensis TaxID=2729421 RepID=A0ABX7W0H1_9BACI|nr:transposase [Sediminibacillus dalangtanensis]QTN00408.1 transposase [Sediminibacillus dalangtanensis]